MEKIFDNITVLPHGVIKIDNPVKICAHCTLTKGVKPGHIIPFVKNDGDSAFNLPSGDCFYEGVCIIKDKKQSHSSFEVFFEMQINFSINSGTIKFHSSEFLTLHEIRHDLEVYGTLDSFGRPENLTFEKLNKRLPILDVFGGKFHGNEAIGVSGILYSSGEFKNYVGCFAGLKKISTT